MTTSLLTLLAFSALLPAAHAQDDAHGPDADGPAFENLFDGKTLSGWHNPYEWGKAWVEDGEIRLQAGRKFFLTSDRKFGDFVLELEVKLPEGKANSGIMFRCHEKKNKVFGYQAEVDPSKRAWSGGLYDEGRRRWLVPLTGDDKKKQRAAFDRKIWNKYRIECRGDWIRIWVNGVLTTDERDPVDQYGPIALQHHGEKGQVYRFRNIRIQDLGRHAWKPLFDGKTLAGWHKAPGGDWTVRDAVIVGTSSKTEKRHGILLSDKVYDDFTVRFRFRSLTGNSGFYFRSDRVGEAVGVKGFQAEIEPAIEGKRCLVGGLYETGGRGWVVRPAEATVKQAYKSGKWNTMTVSAHGPRIVVHVNGRKTAELDNDKGRRKGMFGLQLHGGQDTHVEFRKIELLVPVAK